MGQERFLVFVRLRSRSEILRHGDHSLIERVADLWTEPCDARCITTNGFVKANGSLVMGAGTAGQAQERFPTFPKFAGEAVKLYGNHVYPFSTAELTRNKDKDRTLYITYPVKHVWYEAADLALIERSAHELMSLIDTMALSKILLPLPGCGRGQLRWSDVKPVLEPILDDRVWLINNVATNDFNPRMDKGA